ncbi:MAG: hypothetical protein HY237_14475 [Acidobacteria bacterium]|nr:hypothetical protein [Acidobacteriota bacterium]
MRHSPDLDRGAILLACLALLSSGRSLFGQGVLATAPPAASAAQTAIAPPAQANGGGCIEPESFQSLDRYDGPFKKTSVFITRKLELRNAHRPHARRGAAPCSLGAGEKLMLFVQDTAEPVTFVIAGFQAGLNQAQNNDAPFGQGGAGFGKRYGAALADQASDNFFGIFFYPAIFREDPRYFRMGHGSGGKRSVHAIRHTFLAHSDSGQTMFNFSEWLGTASSVSLGNLYHPDNPRGFGHAAKWTGINIGIDMGFDVLREFLPDISRKLKLPFIRPEPSPAPTPAAQRTPSP